VTLVVVWKCVLDKGTQTDEEKANGETESVVSPTDTPQTSKAMHSKLMDFGEPNFAIRETWRRGRGDWQASQVGDKVRSSVDH
jgi:hypothetical protein